MKNGCMTRVTYHLSPRQLERLRVESERSGLSVAELIRRAVDEWIERRGNPATHRRKIEDQT